MIRLTDQEFLSLVEYLKQNFGINLINKRILLEGRLSNYLLQKGYRSYTEYLAAVKADSTGRELSNLLNRVTTNHTYFMREPDHFEYFAEVVLPYWEGKIPKRDLRTWCAASSSGEEPYTLAMILHDYFGGKIPAWDKTLLATDLSQRVLDQAREGIYLRESLEKIPPAWKKRYFRDLGDGRVQIVDEIRRQVVYRTFNLMDPIAFKEPFHVIFCRNVMIYFDPPTKTALIDRLYDALRPGGYLFVGHTESIARPSRFHYIMPSVYQKGV